MNDLTGQTIGQYELIEEIGRGGMATVYRAHQPSMGRDIAIKVLPRQFTHDLTFLARFEREVEVAARMQHPRVLPVYDYGEQDGMPYIAMAYLPGGTLEDRLAEGPMPLDEAMRLVEQIAEGLDHLHTEGVVHRDFKPSNILLDEDDNIYLTDFGIAKVAEATAQLTGTGIIGTPTYMAPEMFVTGDATPLADVYALGITLYEILAGHKLYDAETPVQHMKAHLETHVPDIRLARPDLPDAVQRVIQTALAKDTEQRFQSAGELAAALREASLEQVTERSRVWLWAVVALVVVALGIGGVWLATGGLGNPAEEESAVLSSTDAPTETLLPTTAPTDTPSLTLTPSPTPIPVVGGGTGILGFNMGRLGYTIDVSCVLAGGVGCNPMPQIMPLVEGVTPNFGSWSPDGTRIAFADLEMVSGRGDNFYDSPYYVVNTDGSGLVEIGRTGLTSDWLNKEDVIPSWSPDGTQVVLVVGGEDKYEPEPGKGRYDYSNMWVVDIACVEEGGSDCTTLLTTDLLRGGSPVWSPDGTHISFARTGVVMEGWATTADIIVIFDLASRSNVTILPPDGVHAYSFSWLPDGTRALYNGTYGLTLFDRSSKLSTPIASIVRQHIHEVAVSPDGRYAALLITPHDQFEIYLLDLACIDDNPPTCEDRMFKVTGTPDLGDLESLSWSPDSSLVAFVGSECVAYCGGHEFWLRVRECDIHLLNVEAALRGEGEDAVTQLTRLRFKAGYETSTVLQWQPLPGN